MASDAHTIIKERKYKEPMVHKQLQCLFYRETNCFEDASAYFERGSAKNIRQATASLHIKNSFTTAGEMCESEDSG